MSSQKAELYASSNDDVVMICTDTPDSYVHQPITQLDDFVTYKSLMTK